jgi:hypothetical protein
MIKFIKDFFDADKDSIFDISDGDLYLCCGIVFFFLFTLFNPFR